jgi:HNH endonuclease
MAPPKKPPQFCSITNCGVQLGRSCGKGMCNKHYTKFRKYGNPLAGRDRSRTHTGYKMVGHRKEHIVLAEKALGGPLPRGACVHHFDEDPTNNAFGNLILCPDQAYHSLLHRRQKALEACGNANRRRCNYCYRYDDPANLYVSPDEKHAHHRRCRAETRKLKINLQKGIANV